MNIHDWHISHCEEAVFVVFMEKGNKNDSKGTPHHHLLPTLYT